MDIRLPLLATALIALAACSATDRSARPVSAADTTVPAATPVPAPASAPAAPVTDGARTQDAQNKLTSTGGTMDSPVTRPAAPDGPRTQDDREKLATTGASVPSPGPTPAAVDDRTVLRGGQNAKPAAAADAAGPTTGNAPMTTGAPAAETPVLPARDASTTQDAQRATADDSGRNKRDDGSLPSPLDQGASETDRAITRSIRQVVVGRDDLSQNAKNVKIITRDGVVTLRGPVADRRERDSIGGVAVAQQGVKRVDNLLEPLQQ